MKKFFETIRNIYNIEELRKRIGYTILLVLIYRLGSFILLPGLDPEVLRGGISGTQEGLVGLLNMFSGGAFGNASIFALGVMPYDYAKSDDIKLEEHEEANHVTITNEKKNYELELYLGDEVDTTYIESQEANKEEEEYADAKFGENDGYYYKSGFSTIEGCVLIDTLTDNDYKYIYFEVILYLHILYIYFYMFLF